MTLFWNEKKIRKMGSVLSVRYLKVHLYESIYNNSFMLLKYNIL